MALVIMWAVHESSSGMVPAGLDLVLNLTDMMPMMSSALLCLSLAMVTLWLLGHPIDGNDGAYASKSRVFRWDGSSWAQLRFAIDDQSGFSVSLSNDGNTFAIGSP